MLVSIVILNYNGNKTLKKCLDSIYKLDFPKKNYEVIVVDNNSKDNSLKIIKKYKKVILIKSKENTGFAKGNNIGIKKAKGKYIAIFNNDLIVNKNWLKELIPIMEKDKKIGALGGKIFYGDGHNVWFSGTKIYYGGFVDHHYLDNNIGESDYIVGAAVIFRKSALNKSGLFDEKMFLYSEDIDLCLRINEKGYKIIYYPRAISYHLIDENRTSSYQEYYEQRNRVYLCAKHYKHPLLFILLDLVALFPLFWLNRVIKNPKKLMFFKETIRARIDSIKMSPK